MLFAFGVSWLINNVIVNLAAKDRTFDYGFLWNRAGYDINQTLIPYPNDSTHGRALFVGLANTLVVALLWDRLGWITLALLTLLWAAVTGVAGWRLALASRREQTPFAATLAEFGRDRAWLMERFGKRRR